MTGCDKVSPGCDHCYALTLAKRLKGMGSAKYQNDGDPRTSGPGFLATGHESELGAPLRWRKPAKVFVNSMSDLFHDNVSDAFIAEVWDVMRRCPQHTFQILTKRHGRMRSLLKAWSPITGTPPWVFTGPWPLPNVWLGVSVENQHWADIRVPALLDTPAAVRFLSCEPLLGPVDLTPWITRWNRAVSHSRANQDHILGPYGDTLDQVDCDSCGFDSVRGIDWVIVGGESGPDARPMHPDWARSLRDQCVAAGVPFLFKQWGGRTPKAGGRELGGRTWDEFPAVTQ